MPRTGTPAGAIPEGTPVSMNLWGFTPRFCPRSTGLRRFCGKAAAQPDERRILPAVCRGRADRSGRASAKVLTTDARWFGVTYREDKPVVSAAIADMTRRGEYPPDL